MTSGNDRNLMDVVRVRVSDGRHLSMYLCRQFFRSMCRVMRGDRPVDDAVEELWNEMNGLCEFDLDGVYGRSNAFDVGVAWGVCAMLEQSLLMDRVEHDNEARAKVIDGNMPIVEYLASHSGVRKRDIAEGLGMPLDEVRRRIDEMDRAGHIVLSVDFGVGGEGDGGEFFWLDDNAAGILSDIRSGHSIDDDEDVCRTFLDRMADR